MFSLYCQKNSPLSRSTAWIEKRTNLMVKDFFWWTLYVIILNVRTRFSLDNNSRVSKNSNCIFVFMCFLVFFNFSWGFQEVINYKIQIVLSGRRLNFEQFQKKKTPTMKVSYICIFCFKKEKIL